MPAGYILSANDQVAVEVFGEDDLRTNGRLNPEGNLNVPLLGSIHLAGLTPTQAASKLTELYSRDYLVNPKINVTLLSYGRRRFTILGQIGHPGIFEMPEHPGGYRSTGGDRYGWWIYAHRCAGTNNRATT